ncbi:MAG: endonuclease/exonuclease/phosphatase family protein [Rhodospirillales bacterium]
MRGDRRKQSFLTVCALLAAALSALAFFGELGWQIDLLAHFRLQAALGSIVLLVIAVARWAKIASLLAAAAIALNVYSLLGVPAATTAPADAPSWRVVAFNLLADDRRIDAVVDWLRQEKFDVVSLEELTPGFAAQLGSLADIYPYRLMEPRKGGFGIGIISRHPFTEQEILFPDSPLRRVLRVSLDFNGAAIEIFALHPPPPLSAALAVEHDTILNSLMALPANPRRIVMGDFNAAPTSFALRHLMARLELAGDGVMPRLTWPSNYPWPLRIPIDHILVGSGLALGGVQSGPPFGSDHLPQIAEIFISALRR